MLQVNLEKVFAEVRKVRVRLESIERTLESLVEALLPEEEISRKEWREIEEIEREMKRGEYVSLEEVERPADIRVDKRDNRRVSLMVSRK